MMEGADVPEIASTEPQHHCPNFIDSVPAEAGFESSDRRETSGGVELGRAASVKRRCRNFAPARAARFVQRRTDNSQARVLLQLGEQHFGKLRLKRQIRVQAQYGVVTFPRRARQEPHDYRLAARRAGSVAG